MWKIEPTRLIAALPESPTISGSQKNWPKDALMTALELSPEEGILAHPGASLMTTAKRRGIDSP